MFLSVFDPFMVELRDVAHDVLVGLRMDGGAGGGVF